MVAQNSEHRGMSMHVKDRLLNYGAGAVSIGELVHLITGASAEQVEHLSAVPADWCLQLQQASQEELACLGFRPAAVAKLLAALELGRRVFMAPPLSLVVDNPQAVAKLLAPEMAFSFQEKFAVVLVDVKNRLIAKRIVSVGTLDETLAHPREIFREAVRLSAAGILVAHNHPSGEIDPSREDMALTQQLLECGRVMQIPVHDHVILSRGSFNSLRRTTALWGRV